MSTRAEVTHPNDWSGFVCVCRRARDSQAAGSDSRLAQKTESGPHLWGQVLCRHNLCRHNLCRSLQQSNLVHAVYSWTQVTPSSYLSRPYFLPLSDLSLPPFPLSFSLHVFHFFSLFWLSFSPPSLYHS